jgi:hypothetical protein
VKNNPNLAEFCCATEMFPSQDHNECLLTVIDTHCPQIDSFSGNFCREVSPTIINKFLNMKIMFSFDIGLFVPEARIHIMKDKRKFKLFADGAWYNGPLYDSNYLALLVSKVAGVLRIDFLNIKDQTIQPILHNIAQNSINIEFVSLTFCYANDLITSLTEIIKKCKKLKELHLISCIMATSQDSLLNALTPSESLTSLTVTTQTHLNTQTIIEIYKRNPKLVLFKNTGGGIRVCEDDVRGYLKANKRYENGFSMM